MKFCNNTNLPFLNNPEDLDPSYNPKDLDSSFKEKNSVL